MNGSMVKVKIDKAIRAIDEFTQSSSFEEADREFKNQLMTIRATLEKMQSSLESEAHPYRLRPFLGRMITDSWPLDLELGEMIIDAEREYFKFIRRGNR